MNCGYNSTSFIDENGDMYVFGENDTGQLGLGHNFNTYTPTKLTVPDLVLAAAGIYHRVVLDIDGLLRFYYREEYNDYVLADKTHQYYPAVAYLCDESRTTMHNKNSVLIPIEISQNSKHARIGSLLIEIVAEIKKYNQPLNSISSLILFFIHSHSFLGLSYESIVKCPSVCVFTMIQIFSVIFTEPTPSVNASLYN